MWTLQKYICKLKKVDQQVQWAISYLQTHQQAKRSQQKDRLVDWVAHEFPNRWNLSSTNLLNIRCKILMKNINNLMKSNKIHTWELGSVILIVSLILRQGDDLSFQVFETKKSIDILIFFIFLSIYHILLFKLFHSLNKIFYIRCW